MKRVLIWGTGKIAVRCLEALSSENEVLAFVESIVDKEIFMGKKVISGSSISTVNFDCIIIANTHEREILSQFKLNKDKIVVFREVIDGDSADIYGLFNRKDSGIYISYGENCLTDRILERYHFKSFATPYSWVRSNIEYINEIEDNDFAYLLSADYLECKKLGGAEKQIVRSSYYIRQNNIYNASVMNGFEFTHHDVLNNEEHIASFERKIKRIKEISQSELYIFYHHRYCQETNEDKLLSDLYKLYTRYTDKRNKVNIIMFTQKIVNKKEDRKVKYQKKGMINIFWFYTLDVWGGCDENIFWAKSDDDLITKMMDFVKEGKLNQNLEDIIVL